MTTKPTPASQPALMLDLSKLERVRETYRGLEVHSEGHLVYFSDVQDLLAAHQPSPRLIPDAECEQSKCACTTSGCWGECSLKRFGNSAATVVVAETPSPARSDKEAERAKSGTLDPAGCAFCGGSATYLVDRISCDSCLADMGRAKGQSDEELLAAWSRRAGQAQERAPSSESIDTAEFRELAEFWSGKYHSALAPVRQGHKQAWEKLVAYIDALCATAGTTTAPAEYLPTDESSEVIVEFMRRHGCGETFANYVRTRVMGDFVQGLASCLLAERATAGNAAPTEQGNQHEEKHARADHQGAAQDEGHDAGRVGLGGGAGADQHHQHREAEPAGNGRSGGEDRGGAGASDRGEVRAAAGGSAVQETTASPLEMFHVIVNQLVNTCKEFDPRFFMDHGVWHDRVTGQHMWTQDEYDAQWRLMYKAGQEDAAIGYNMLGGERATAGNAAPTCRGCDPAEGFCKVCRDAEQRASNTATAAPDEGACAAALRKIIEMNRQQAEHQYGDANKAESWSCIVVAREALAATAAPGDLPPLPKWLAEGKGRLVPRADAINSMEEYGRACIASNAGAAPAEAYRLLDRRDIIQKDDEWLREDGVTWIKGTPVFIGMEYLRNVMLPARRRIAPSTSPVGAKEKEHG